MSTFLHYSFDLWLTLIRSNPLFKLERAKHFYNRYNQKGKSLHEVELAFREVDLMCNAINEKTGGNISSEEMYLMVISRLHDYEDCFQQLNVDSLGQEMEALFFEFTPQIYCDETLNTLQSIKKKNVTLSILSNTGFIKGSLLRKMLAQLELESLFEFQIYSDEEGMSKPNKELFRKLIDQVSKLRGPCSTDEIIHIGDNPLADVWGANQTGLQSLLVHSNNKPISSILN